MKITCWNCGMELNSTVGGEWVAYLIRYKLRPGAEYDEKANKEPKEAWKRFYCDKCEAKQKELDEKEMEEYILLKAKVMYKRALRILERQKLEYYQYKEAMEVVEQYTLNNPSTFESSHEMIAAIILVHNRIMSKAQYKIGNRRVDFLLPDLKCILEVDGFMHEHKQLEDSNRDIKLRGTLGPEWEVVRIPTDLLEKNAKRLPEAIIALRDEKKKIREKNMGIIPSNFSKRDKAKSKEVERIVSEKR